jgi:CPA2 family monovalent cation:H+ antiporter-2
VARFLGFDLASRVFPAAGRQQLDLAAAPRRLLVVMLQLGIVLAVGLPLVAITQPFLPPLRGAAALSLVVIILSFTFWRSATNFQGHTRAGAQAIVDALSRQMRSTAIGSGEPSLEAAHQILSGLGSPTPVVISKDSPLVGKSLAELKLRGLTGATVLAIQRGDRSVVIPSGHDRLEGGDVLALAGTKDAVAAARELLVGSHANKVPVTLGG